ncbi:MAG: Mth938-like domain-containing protein [Rhodobacteraceae bacterium]|nr:Mth938-like domain-containing protein [Paracoccaceae bacterium]
MQLDEMSFDGPTPVEGYGPGFFRVAGEVFDGAQALLPGRVQGWAGLADFAPFLAAADVIDVLLVGTGADIAPLPTDQRRALEAAGIGVEVMATPSACRTYNVLLAEGRRVAAALLPV